MLSPAVKFDQVTPQEAPYYYQFMKVVNAVRKIAMDKFNTENVFQFSPYFFLLYNVFEEDCNLKDGRLELISTSVDAACDFNIIGTEQDPDSKFMITPNHTNLIGYYPEYDVIVANYSFVTANFYFDTRSQVFGKDEATVKRFMDYVHQRDREISRSKVTVFTDTSRGVNKTRMPLNRGISRDDVFLDEKFKTEIFRSIDTFFNGSREFYTKHNIPYRRGILLYGKPGNGKTTLVKSIAGSINAPVVYWQITEFTTSESISEVMNYAAEVSPVVLVIEDIDSMPNSARSAFLNSLDGATSKEGIFLIGTTNYPDKIDPALRNRAGRFDRSYEITLPNADMREHYLVKKGILDIVSQEELEGIVKAFEGFSIATLNEVYTEVAVQKHVEDSVDVKSIIDRFKEEDKKQTKGTTESDKMPTVGFNVNTRSFDKVLVTESKPEEGPAIAN